MKNRLLFLKNVFPHAMQNLRKVLIEDLEVAGDYAYSVSAELEPVIV